MIRHKCDKCQQVKEVKELEYVHGLNEGYSIGGIVCNDCKEKQENEN